MTLIELVFILVFVAAGLKLGLVLVHATGMPWLILPGWVGGVLLLAGAFRCLQLLLGVALGHPYPRCPDCGDRKWELFADFRDPPCYVCPCGLALRFGKRDGRRVLTDQDGTVRFVRRWLVWRPTALPPERRGGSSADRPSTSAIDASTNADPSSANEIEASTSVDHP